MEFIMNLYSFTSMIESYFSYNTYIYLFIYLNINYNNTRVDDKKKKKRRPKPFIIYITETSEI